MILKICILAMMMVHKSNLHLKSRPLFCMSVHPSIHSSICPSVCPSIHYACFQWFEIRMNSRRRERQFWTDKKDCESDSWLFVLMVSRMLARLAFHRGKSTEPGRPLGKPPSHGSSPIVFFLLWSFLWGLKGQQPLRARGSPTLLPRGQSVGVHTLS